jgi:DNA-binding SARP family transcriptional activator
MLRIWLVGEVRVEVDGRRRDTIASRRARSLLAWLAYHPGLHPRSRVAAVFWPDVLESSARASLRTTLATLRRDLGEEAARHLAAERADVGIVDGPDVWIDVREFGRLAPA